MSDVKLDGLSWLAICLAILGMTGVFAAVVTAWAARRNAWPPTKCVEYDEDSAAEHDARVAVVCVRCSHVISGSRDPDAHETLGICDRCYNLGYRDEKGLQIETICMDCGVHIRGPLTGPNETKTHGLCEICATIRLRELRRDNAAAGKGE